MTGLHGVFISVPLLFVRAFCPVGSLKWSRLWIPLLFTHLHVRTGIILRDDQRTRCTQESGRHLLENLYITTSVTQPLNTARVLSGCVIAVIRGARRWYRWCVWGCSFNHKENGLIPGFEKLVYDRLQGHLRLLRSVVFLWLNCSPAELLFASSSGASRPLTDTTPCSMSSRMIAIAFGVDRSLDTYVF